MSFKLMRKSQVGQDTEVSGKDILMQVEKHPEISVRRFAAINP